MDRLTDAELVERARAGDKDAFGVLIELYSPSARNAVLRILGSPELADEIVQEAVLQAMVSLDRLQNQASFGSWLYGIALNLSRNHLRKTARRKSLESNDDQSDGHAAEILSEPGPEDTLESTELSGLVWSAVSALSDARRSATVLFYYGQFSIREIADELGVSESAVKVRLHRARSDLRDSLGQILAYHGYRGFARREKGRAMARVTIADVVAREIGDDPPEYPSSMQVVVLREEDGDRALPIWIGAQEALSIAMGLKSVESPRPMTHRFAADVIKGLGAEVEEVRIEALKGDTFYAIVKLRLGDKTMEVDARPSDAMALAVHVDAPIFAAEEVIDSAGRTIPSGALSKDAEAQGLADLMKTIEENMQTWFSGREKPTPERIQKATKEIVEQVFGPQDEEE